ncbi:MAG TPA: YraN family protein [Desulfobacteraceae bacterium]|nr:YraN family protein [Desulfobacteraceae bacterium]
MTAKAPPKHLALGKAGEDAAARYLESRGYTILERNFRHKTFEMDIIARDGDTLCFIEVKTRSNTRKAMPREAVHHAKQKKMLLGATWYLKHKQLADQRARFDVVEVVYPHKTPGPNDIPHITLIPNAFHGG